MVHQRINVKDISNLKDSNAFIDIYIPGNSIEIDSDKKRKTIVICPGGGYEFTSDREAEPIALNFISKGFNAIILRYSLKPNRFPKALLELASVINYTRSKSNEWNVDNDKIVVCGFSAGGHLAGSIGVLWNDKLINENLNISNENVKPNGLILCYPVINGLEYANKWSFDSLLGEDASEKRRRELSLEELVSKDTPKTFLWHTFDDDAVPVENSLLFANSLRKNNIPFELHIYPSGVHGLGLANELTASKGECKHINPHVSTWFDLVVEWIESI